MTKKVCLAVGCFKSPSWGWPDQRRRLCCARHGRELGMYPLKLWSTYDLLEYLIQKNQNRINN